jgi:hypothetical protein
MNLQLTRCPVCEGELIVTRLHCPQCDTTIEGFFRPKADPFAALAPEQMDFLISFIRCEGRFNRMEKDLNMSYPTLRNRLDEIIRALGFEPEPVEQPVKPQADERRKILEGLEKGEITFEEAQALLRGERLNS